MRITDAQWIPANLHQTWQALFDPSVLRQCMPGLVKTAATSATDYQFALRASVGGVKSDYDGELLLCDVDQPNSFCVAFESKGDATGLVIGNGRVELSEKDGGTRIAYSLELRTGGLLAQMGEPAVQKAVEHLFERFFNKFIDYAARLPREAPPPKPEPEEPSKGLIHSNWSWLLVAVLIAALATYHYIKH